MKKFIAFFLCLIVMFSLISCDVSEKNPSITDEESDTVTESIGETDSISKINLYLNHIAIQAFDAVIREETTLIYGGRECFFSDLIYNDKTYVHAKVDMDNDGVEEYFIKDKSNNRYYKDKIVLHYDSGTVYGYSFSYNMMDTVFKDGSFLWYYEGDSGFPETQGRSLITFKEQDVKFWEIYRVENGVKYYVDGAHVSEDEYSAFLESMDFNQVEFVYLEILSWRKEKAIEIASEYWGVEQDSFNDKTGYRYRLECSIESKNKYRICLYEFVNNSYYNHLDHICVNIDTGEISVPEYPDAKG